MKRYVRASEGEKVRSTFTLGRSKRKYSFQGEVFKDGPVGVAGQITRIAPYDDADYFWAKITRNGAVKFIRDGKVLDKMQLWSYEEDDYENVDEYIDDVVTQTAETLDGFNDKVQQRMMYN